MYDLKIKFTPRDLWVGLYTEVTEGLLSRYTFWYFCIVPMFPICWVTFKLRRPTVNWSKEFQP